MKELVVNKFTGKINTGIVELFVCVFLFLAMSTISNTQAAENLVNSKLSDGTILTLNGIGKAKRYSDDYYLGALYLTQRYKTSDDITYLNSSKRMTIKIAYNKVSSRRFGQYWKEAISINNPRDIWEPQVNDVIDFVEFFKQDLYRGDVINIDFLPNKGTFVTLNGLKLGGIRNPSFYNLLLMTWLGDRAPNPAFKRGVMGLNSDESHVDEVLKIQQQFQQLNPTKKRIQQVRSKQLKLAKTKEGTPKKKSKIVKKDNSKTKSQKKTVSKSPSKTKSKAVAKKTTPKKTNTKIATAKIQPKINLANSKTQSLKVTKSKPKAKVVKKKPKPVEKKLSASDRLKLFEMRSAYGALLRKEIRKHQAFPLKKMLRIRSYRKKMEKGPVQSNGIIWIKIARDGSVMSSRMEESTGVKQLDQSALEMVEKADPLPKMPKKLEGNEFEFLVKVSFVSPQL